jgi:hypothetical protein
MLTWTYIGRIVYTVRQRELKPERKPKMKAKTMTKLEAEKNLMAEILEAIQKATIGGLSNDDITTVLNRISEVISNEE